MLEKQFEHTLEPALVEPGHAVEAGESWPLDESLTRRFLLSRGIRVLELGDPATATLQHATGASVGSEWVVDYRIPIARFELEGVSTGVHDVSVSDAWAPFPASTQRRAAIAVR